MELEQSVRNSILKLNASQFYINELPTDASFSIRLQTAYYSFVEFNQDPNYEVSTNNGIIHSINCTFSDVSLGADK